MHIAHIYGHENVKKLQSRYTQICKYKCSHPPCQTSFKFIICIRYDNVNELTIQHSHTQQVHTYYIPHMGVRKDQWYPKSSWPQLLKMSFKNRSHIKFESTSTICKISEISANNKREIEQICQH